MKLTIQADIETVRLELKLGCHGRMRSDYYNEMIDALCDLALRGLNAGDQWRTMESAPRDQTILISGHWDDGKGWVGEAIWCASGYDEGWAADKEGFERGETYMQPDHWQPMPLPAPPAMKEKP